MSKKVTYAKLHDELFLPGGVGNLGKVLPSQGKTVRGDGLKMTYDSDGLHVSANGINCLIPPASVFMVVYVEVPDAQDSKSTTNAA